MTKSGNTSLARALSILGYRHLAWNESNWQGQERFNISEKSWNPLLPESPSKKDRKALASWVLSYESFSDWPWNHWDIYRDIDQLYPQSKFILTYRKPESWIVSYQRHWQSQASRFFPNPDWVKNFDQHRHEHIHNYSERIKRIKNYFRSRSNDFLCLEITAGEGWDELCPFLGLPIPDKTFPHLNATLPLR